MFKTLRPLSFLKLSRRCCSTTCAPFVSTDPRVDMSVLSNGIRIATEYKPEMPIAVTALYVEAGSRFEAPCNNGICHFIEHMAYKGFSNMTQFELECLLSHTGAQLTVHTGREIQSFTARYFPDHAETIVDILGSVMTDLLVDPCVAQLERDKISLEVEDRENNPRALVSHYLHQTAYQGTPLGQSVIGPSKNLDLFTPQYAVNFLCEHYQPFKMCFVTSGSVPHESMVELVERKLGCLVADGNYVSDDGPCRFTGSAVQYRNDSMPYAHVAIALEAPGYLSQDYLPLLVASNMVGSWHRSCGGALMNGPPLARAAAHDELCESFESFYISYKDTGLWGIYFVCDLMNIENMVENIQDQWMKLTLAADRGNVERGKNLTKLQLRKRADGCMNSVHNIGKQMIYSCGTQTLEDKLNVVDCTRFEMLRETTERVLYDRCPAVAAVGPVENLPEYNRIRSGQYWLRC